MYRFLEWLWEQRPVRYKTHERLVNGAREGVNADYEDRIEKLQGDIAKQALRAENEIKRIKRFREDELERLKKENKHALSLANINERKFRNCDSEKMGLLAAIRKHYRESERIGKELDEALTVAQSYADELEALKKEYEVRTMELELKELNSHENDVLLGFVPETCGSDCTDKIKIPKKEVQYYKGRVVGVVKRIARNPYVVSVTVRGNVGSTKSKNIKIKDGGLDFVYSNDNFGYEIFIRTTAKDVYQTMFVKGVIEKALKI